MPGYSEKEMPFDGGKDNMKKFEAKKESYLETMVDVNWLGD